MNAKRITGAILASAAAGLFAVAAVPAAKAAEGSEVMCAGVNACKGHGSCKSATNACKGQNACRGKGVVAMSEEACKAIGGTYSPQPEKKT